MISTLLKALQSIAPTQLESWANQVHGWLVPLMAAIWCWPLLRALFKKLRNDSPDIEWVSLWRCPNCSTFNRRLMLDCSHCEYHLKLGGLAKWVPLKLSEFYKRTRRQILFAYSVLGWTIFYAVTAFTFWKLRLFSFQQAPIQELLACAAMILVVCALVFYRRAMITWVLSPVGALVDFFAGIVITGLVALTITLWSAAPYPAGRPLGYFNIQRNGWVDVERPGEMSVRGQGAISGPGIRFDVHYTVIYWPRVGYRQVILTRVAGKPLHPKWKMNLNQKLPRWLPQERLIHPKWATLTQTLTMPPGATYAVHDAFPAPGLGLRKIESPK